MNESDMHTHRHWSQLAGSTVPSVSDSVHSWQLSTTQFSTTSADSIVENLDEDEYDSAVFQLINYYGDLIPTALGRIEAFDSKFHVISVLGPQGGGKSTLLNELFLTNFQVLDESREHANLQTTQGVWAAFRTVEGCPALLLDVQGFDDIKADNGLTEGKLAVFILQVSNLILFNVDWKSIGQGTASGMNIVSAMFEAAQSKTPIVAPKLNGQAPVSGMDFISAVCEVTKSKTTELTENAARSLGIKTDATKNTLMFWSDVMQKNTSVIFVLRDGKPRSILKISYIQDNMREMWRRIYHKDVWDRLDEKRALPVQEYILPMIDTEARTTPSAYTPILTPHKLLKSFDEEIAGLRDLIGAKLLKERSSATDASDLEVVWSDSCKMASTVKWAGTLGDRRAELDCQTVASRILEELDEKLVSLDNDSEAFESLILKLSSHWMLDLNTDTKRRTEVLKRESEAFFRQLEQAVKREERRRQDVALAGARERDRYKIELNKVRLETQQQAAELRQALEAEKAKRDRTEQQAQEDAERNRLAQEQVQLLNERDRRRAHVIRLANDAAAHIENLAETGKLVVDQQNFDEVIESFMISYAVRNNLDPEESALVKVYVRAAFSRIWAQQFEELAAGQGGFLRAVREGLVKAAAAIADSVWKGAQKGNETIRSIFGAMRMKSEA